MRKIIRADQMTFEQRQAFVEEAERQGCHVRMSPLEQAMILHGSRKRATFTYETWAPALRKISHVRTLWPRRLPKAWQLDGPPRGVITRPVPHPERLLAVLKATQ